MYVLSLSPTKYVYAQHVLSLSPTKYVYTQHVLSLSPTKYVYAQQDQVTNCYNLAMSLYDIVYKNTATVLCTLPCVHADKHVCVCMCVHMSVHAMKACLSILHRKKMWTECRLWTRLLNGCYKPRKYVASSRVKMGSSVNKTRRPTTGQPTPAPYLLDTGWYISGEPANSPSHGYEMRWLSTTTMQLPTVCSHSVTACLTLKCERSESI